MTEPIKRVPARYIGTHPVIVQGGAIDLQGKRIGGLLQYGDVILMPEREVKGQTLLRQNDQLFDLGAGKVVRKEDQGKSDEELAVAGYEFHQGRSDFVPAEETTAEVPTEIAAPVQPEPVPMPVSDEAPPIQEPAQEEEELQ